MKNLPLLFLILALFSCWDDDTPSIEPDRPDQSGPQFIVTDVFGVQYPTLDPSKIYCGPGWGTKMCHFLHKYDGTIWADTEHYYGEVPDVQFSNFWSPFFISFFDIDSTASHCEGWKLNETAYNGVRWNIRITKDQEDVLWFDYDYYGSGDAVEYTITYKYEVVDGLLRFSSTDGQSFTYHPSERNYARDAVNTGEIIELDGCLFY